MKMTIDQFKKYYEEYYKNLLDNKEEIDEVLDQWKIYKDKIDNKTLTTLEYNSIKENFNNNENHYSLQYFIEKGSDVLGGFGMMISSNIALWVKGKKDNLEYYDCRDAKSGNRIEITEADANTILKEILEYLRNLFNQKTIEDVVAYMDNQALTNSFIQKAFLIKMIVLNSWTNDNIDYNNKLIFIYNFSKGQTLEILDGNKKNKIEFLYDSKLSNIEKNYKLTTKLLEILDIKNPTIYELNKIGRCYWELTGSVDRDLILNDDNKNIIFYGPPGTGKTYTVKKALCDNNNIVTKYVQFHPGFTYEDFIEGIKPCGIDNSGNLKFEIVNGVFKQFCIEALHDQTKEYYFVADEINRANLSSVFGETLSLLEEDYRYDPNNKNAYQSLISTPLSNVIKSMYENASDSEKDNINKLIFYRDEGNNDIKFGIPKNVHFIGMMNDVDKSIDTFDLALRRRFIWIRKGFEERPIELYLMDKGISSNDIDTYIKQCKKLNYFITGYDYKNFNKKDITSLNLGMNFELGHSIFMKIKVSNKKIKDKAYNSLFDMHISTTLKEYLRTSLSDIDLDNTLDKAKNIFIGKNE